VTVLAMPQSLIDFLEGHELLERVPPDEEFARRVLDDVVTEECEDVLHAAAQSRWRKANTYSYNGARKSVEAFLQAHGWRVRNARGAHMAVVDAAQHWLAAIDDRAGPRIGDSFATSRKARGDDEYPSSRAPVRTDKELRPLVLDNVRLINAVREHLSLDVRRDLVPTEENLSRRPERTVQGL
jgi:hypothetical protein